MKTPENRRRPDDFRLIRVFSVDHNLARLRRHVERLTKKDRMTVVGRRVAFLGRRAKRSEPA